MVVLPGRLSGWDPPRAVELLCLVPWRVTRGSCLCTGTGAQSFSRAGNILAAAVCVYTFTPVVGRLFVCLFIRVSRQPWCHWGWDSSSCGSERALLFLVSMADCTRSGSWGSHRQLYKTDLLLRPCGTHRQHALTSCSESLAFYTPSHSNFARRTTSQRLPPRHPPSRPHGRCYRRCPTNGTTTATAGAVPTLNVATFPPRTPATTGSAVPTPNPATTTATADAASPAAAPATATGTARPHGLYGRKRQWRYRRRHAPR